MAVIGHGPVARALVAVTGRPAAVICRPGRETAAEAAMGAPAVTEAATLPEGLDCVVEAGGHAGLRAHGAAVLDRGLDLIAVSLGALADDSLMTELAAAAERAGARLHLATGTIGALDALSAAREGGLTRVVYTGRKPPTGWAGSPAQDILDLAVLAAPATHFEGTARACALAYPKNANVAAAVALAGLGFDATEARLVADPTIGANLHEIEAEGAFGRLTFRIEGRGLPDTPRSSALTAMSLVRAVRDRRRAVTFG
ncbi:aspartate dehydrogenase [Rhodovulum sp. 12E13]|nr:aspartate dehydrogenase [Rhodovulum sp. 12E13]